MEKHNQILMPNKQSHTTRAPNDDATVSVHRQMGAIFSNGTDKKLNKIRVTHHTCIMA